MFTIAGVFVCIYSLNFSYCEVPEWGIYWCSQKLSEVIGSNKVDDARPCSMSDEQISHGSEDANLEHETDRPFIFAACLCVSWNTSNHGLTSSSITKASKSETLIFCLLVPV